MIRPIAPSLSPNAELSDVLVSIGALCNIRAYFDQKYRLDFESSVRKVLGEGCVAFSTGSGRSALFLALKALGIKKDDEVIMQAFSCVVVANSINSTGARVVFADIDESFNLSPIDLQTKINKNTRAVVVQNTFGINCDYKSIKTVISEAEKKYGNKIFLIEDGAHSFGGEWKRLKVGMVGDVGFFSLGRDKVLSSVNGGVLVTKDRFLADRISDIYQNLPQMPTLDSLLSLIHPILMSICILPFYNFGLGKITVGKLLLALFIKIGVIKKPVSSNEMGGVYDRKIFKLSSLCSILAIAQIKKLGRYNKKRSYVAGRYFRELGQMDFCELPKKQEAVWLRFPLLIGPRDLFFEFAKKRGVLLGKWYSGIIDPCRDLGSIGYRKGSCVTAEKVSREIINLPTYPTLSESQVGRVVDLFKTWKSTQRTK